MVQRRNGPRLALEPGKRLGIRGHLPWQHLDRYVAAGLPWRYRAATPAVCGVAIDVPLIVFVDVSVSHHADVMFTPGANQSTQEPKFEKLALASAAVVAPTVIASATPDGEPAQASALSLPAATA